MAHTGWKILITQEIADEITKLIGNQLMDDRRDVIYTAVEFRKDLTGMASWYKQRCTKIRNGDPTLFYISGIYSSRKNGLVVADGLIDGIPYYVTLTHSKIKLALITCKEWANSGKLGPRIAVDPKIKIECEPYIEGVDDKYF